MSSNSSTITPKNQNQKIVIATVASGSYVYGAETLFGSIKRCERNVNMRLMRLMTKSDNPSVLLESIGVEQHIITNSSETLSLHFSERFRGTALKFAAINFLSKINADYLVLIDSDIFFNTTNSILSEITYDPQIENFAGCEDLACRIYYPGLTDYYQGTIGKVFNTGFLVFRQTFFEEGNWLEFTRACREGLLKSYDSGDQGYMNHFAAMNDIKIRWLDLKFNYPLDIHYPKINPEIHYGIHFTGIKPWFFSPNTNDYFHWAYRAWWQSRALSYPTRSKRINN